MLTLMTSSLVRAEEGMRGAVPVVTIWVCVGSSCFLRGAPDVIKAFEAEIERRAPRQVELKGTFCQELCTMGVTVRVGDKVFTGVTPGDVPRIFEEEIIPMIDRGGETERDCDVGPGATTGGES